MALLVGCQPDQLDPANAAGTDAPARVVDLGLSAGVQDGARGHFGRGRACAAADFDGDGRTDLFVGNPGDESYIMRNITEPDGAIQFEPGPVLSDDGLMWGGTAADFDNDGDVDLFVSCGGNEGAAPDHLFVNHTAPGGPIALVEATADALLFPVDDYGEPRFTYGMGSQWVDYDRDGLLDLFVNVNALALNSLVLEHPRLVGQNLLWHNEGDGTFTDQSAQVGLVSRGPSRHSTWLDFDNDGDMDLFELNHGRPNIVWQNQFVESGTASFEQVTAQVSLAGSNLAYPLNTFSSIGADFNNDGWQDLFVFTRGWADEGPHLGGHVLFLNVGGKGFVDVSSFTGLDLYFEAGEPAPSETTEMDMLALGVMGSSVLDANGDGLPDIWVGNGGMWQGHDNQLLVSEGLAAVEIEDIGQVVVPTYGDWSHLFQFPAPETAFIKDYPPSPYRTHGTCFADLDDDGLPEIFVVNGGPAVAPDEVREPDRLFKIELATPAQALTVHPVGDGTRVNRSAIGTRVAARIGRSTDGSQWMVRGTLTAGSGFSAQHGPDILLGLGDADVVHELVVNWPDGTVQHLDNLKPGQRIVVEMP